MKISQYHIVLVNLDPTVGSEIKKTRPCLIVSPDEMNEHLRTVIVAPMTTSKRSYPSRFALKHVDQASYVALDQLRTIDKSRIIKDFGPISDSSKRKCKANIKEMLVD